MRILTDNPRLNRLTGYLALLVCLSWLPGPAVGMVFCLSGDGHCEMEFARGGRCTTSPLDKTEDPSRRSDLSKITGQVDNTSRHCNTCFDLPLPLGEHGLRPHVQRVTLQDESRIISVIALGGTENPDRRHPDHQLPPLTGNRLALPPLLASTILII